MNLINKARFDEVVELGIKLTGLSDLFFVKEILNYAIFRIIFNISLEIVTVHLLLFSQPAEEVSIVLSPSFSLAVKHTLLSAFEIFWVAELSGFKLFDLVEKTIELLNRLFDSNPSLVGVAAVRDLELNSLSS